MRRAYGHGWDEKTDLEGGSLPGTEGAKGHGNGAGGSSDGHAHAGKPSGAPQGLKGAQHRSGGRGDLLQILVVMVVIVVLLNAGNLLGVGQYLMHEGAAMEGDHNALLELRQSEMREEKEVHQLESTVKSLKDELALLKSQLKQHESNQEKTESELKESVTDTEREIEQKVKEEVEEVLEEVKEELRGGGGAEGAASAALPEALQQEGAASGRREGLSLSRGRLTMPKPILLTDMRSRSSQLCEEDESCTDAAVDCYERARRGDCATDYMVMMHDCRRSCGHCKPCNMAPPPIAPQQQKVRLRPAVQEGTFYVYNETANGPECAELGQCYHAEAWVAAYLAQRGFRRVSRWAEAEFIWTFSAEYGYNMKWLQDSQMVNHVGNTFQTLADKARLFPTLESYSSLSGCTMETEPHLLPWTADATDSEQCKALVNILKTQPSRQWLLKPRGGSGGTGIRLFKSNADLLAEIMPPAGREAAAAGVERCRGFTTGEPDVAQEYINNPLLLKGLNRRKFNLRAYMLISSVEPFVAFMHMDGYAGSSMQSYNASGHDLAVHLTGMHTQAKESSYDGDERVRNWDRLSDIITEELDTELDAITKGRPFREWLQERLMRTLLWLLYAGRDSYERKPGSFNALAVDLLLDDNLKLWVLEVNAYPWMAWETEWGKQWMHGLVTEMLDIQLEVWGRKKAGKPLSKIEAAKKWKILTNEDSGEALYGFKTCPYPL